MSKTPPDPQVTRPPRILVIDDSKTILVIMRRILAREGWDVLTAGSKVQALVLADTAPDIVLLDLSVAGGELTRDLKALGCDVVILFSNQSPSEMRRIAKEVGADGVVHKGHTGEDALKMLLRKYRP